MLTLKERAVFLFVMMFRKPSDLFRLKYSYAYEARQYPRSVLKAQIAIMQDSPDLGENFCSQVGSPPTKAKCFEGNLQ